MNIFERLDTITEGDGVDKNIVTILMGRRKELEEKLASKEITIEEREKLEEFLIETKMMCEIEELTKENTFLLNELENNTNLTEDEKVTIRATITRNQNRIIELQENLQERKDKRFIVEVNNNTSVTEGGKTPEQIEQIEKSAKRWRIDNPENPDANPFKLAA